MVINLFLFYVEIVIEFLKFNFDKNNKKIVNNIF